MAESYSLWQDVRCLLKLRMLLHAITFERFHQLASACRPQSKRSEGAKAKVGGALKFAHKTDLNILYDYNYAQIRPAALISLLVLFVAHDLLKNLSTAVNATKRATRILLKEVNNFFFAKKKCLILPQC